MNGTCLTIFSILSLLSAACVQSPPGANGLVKIGYSDARPLSWEAHARIFQSANDCAPDWPEPVWGKGSSLLGYSCVRPSSNNRWRGLR